MNKIIRPAHENDVLAIYQLLAFYALKQIVLPRTEADILFRIHTDTYTFGASKHGNDMLSRRCHKAAPID